MVLQLGTVGMPICTHDMDLFVRPHLGNNIFVYVELHRFDEHFQLDSRGWTPR